MGWLTDLRERRLRRKFLDGAMHAAQQAGRAVELYDEELFCLSLTGGAKWFLHNTFTEWVAASAQERPVILARYAAALGHEIPEDFSVVRDRLVPRVRPRSMASILELTLRVRGEAVTRSLKTQGAEAPVYPIGRGLEAVLAIDSDDSVAMLGEIPSSWRVSADEAWELALDNLRSMSTDPLREVAPGLFVSPWQDNHDASRICIPELFRPLMLRGDPVVALPNRDHLFVTGSDDPDGLMAMGQCCKQLIGDGRAIHGGAFVLRELRWMPLSTSPTDGATSALHSSYVCDRADTYSEQGAVLQKLYELSGEDRFVASLLIVEEKDTRTQRSLTTWGEGVSSALPEADQIAFVRDSDLHPNSGMIRVAWRDAIEIVGHYLTLDPSLYPERYLVDAFPSEAELSLLEARAK